jgi:hypothetical protein
MSFKRSIAAAGAVGLFAITSLGAATLASSHREAPLISKDPAADNTDLYAFVSPDKPNTITIIANYDGLQEPAGGPNFYPFDPDVLYWIKVDNNGDGLPDVEYDFRFHTNVANPGSFLYSGYGPIPAVPSNVTQTYTVTRNAVNIGSGLRVPAPSIGPRTTPNYWNIGKHGVHSLSDSNGMVFAGQRDDPFFVDLGSIFDLGGLRPFNPAHLIPLPAAAGQDTLSGDNVNTIAIQVPKPKLTSDGLPVSGPGASNAVVGIWAGASRHATTVLSNGTSTPSGPWVQVSRLGNPLINEVLIGLGQKDQWNGSDPVNDSSYTSRYTDPELAAIINVIYPSLPDARTTGRSDLVLILGQGVPGLNATNSGSTLYDYLRLNMGVPPTAHPSRMGVMAGDLAGFPNGRRLGDDVVDIELRAIADGYGKFLHDNFGLPNHSPNNLIGDGCNVNDRPWLSAFPYVGRPWQGYTGGHYRASPCVQQVHPEVTATSQAASMFGLSVQSRLAIQQADVRWVGFHRSAAF